MSEELGFKFNVDPGNSQKTVSEFKSEIAAARENLVKITEEFGATSEQASAAKQEIDKLNNALKAKSATGFKQQLKEAKETAFDMVRQFGEFSPQAIAAAKNLGALKDEMADLNQLADGLTDEAKFRSFAELGGSIAGGFSAAQGAITLATGGSKEFETQMLKVQSAMALAEGLSQIAEIGRTWGQAKAALLNFTIVQKANSAATATAAAIQKLFAGAVDTTSTSFKVLKGAIIATGIGALVAAVGYVINNFNSLKETLFKLLPFLETVSKFIGKIVEATTDFVGVTSAATREADKLREAITTQNDAHDKQIQLLEASGAKSKDIRGLKGKMYDEEIEKLNRISTLKGKASDEDAKQVKELQFKKELLKAEQSKEDRDAAEEAKKKADEAHKKALADGEKRNKDIIAARKKYAEETEKNHEEALKKWQENIDKANDRLKDKHAFELALLKASGKEALGIREAQIDEEIATLTKLGGTKSKDAIVALEREKVLVAAQAKTDAEAALKEAADKQTEKENEVRDALKKDAEDLLKEGQAKDLYLLQEKYDAMFEVVKGNEQLTTAITESENAARAAIVKKWDDIQAKNKAETLNKIGGLLSGFADLAGKNTAVGKGLAIASATIDTYQGATAALKATAGLPFIGTAMGIANAALIVGNGIKNVREIVKTKVPNASDNSGGGSPSATAASTSSPAVSTAPTMDGIQSTLVQQTKELTAGKDALKAYVVESEITQKQERQRAITQTANF